MLLIDELDKSDIHLPNDLLAVAGASSCEQAIDALAGQVVDPDAYATSNGVTTSTRADGRWDEETERG